MRLRASAPHALRAPSTHFASSGAPLARLVAPLAAGAGRRSPSAARPPSGGLLPSGAPVARAALSAASAGRRPPASPAARDRSRRRGAERGSALPEFALSFPLLLLALLTLIQLALVVHAQHVVTAAAQEGARVAATAGRTPQEGHDYARALLRAGLGTPAGDFSVAVGPEPPDGDVTTAAVSGVYPLYVPLPGGGLPLRATARVRTDRFRAGRW